MNRRRRVLALLARLYLAGLLVWLTLILLIALGGAITDQPAEVVNQSQDERGA